MARAFSSEPLLEQSHLSPIPLLAHPRTSVAALTPIEAGAVHVSVSLLLDVTMLAFLPLRTGSAKTRFLESQDMRCS